MKNLFKNKKVIIILSSVLAVLLIAGTVFCLTRPKSTPPAKSEETTLSDTDKDINIDKPEESDVESSV